MEAGSRRRVRVRVKGRDQQAPFWGACLAVRRLDLPRVAHVRNGLKIGTCTLHLESLDLGKSTKFQKLIERIRISASRCPVVQAEFYGTQQSVDF